MIYRTATAHNCNTTPITSILAPFSPQGILTPSFSNRHLNWHHDFSSSALFPDSFVLTCLVLHYNGSESEQTLPSVLSSGCLPTAHSLFSKERPFFFPFRMSILRIIAPTSLNYYLWYLFHTNIMAFL